MKNIWSQHLPLHHFEDVVYVYSTEVHICQTLVLKYKILQKPLKKFPLTKWFYVRINCICRISRRSFPSFLLSFSPDSGGSKHCWSWSKIHQIESELELLQGFEFISGLRIVSHFFSSNISRKLVNLFIREQNCLEDLCNLTFLINCKFYSEVADSKI